MNAAVIAILVERRREPLDHERTVQIPRKRRVAVLGRDLDLQPLRDAQRPALGLPALVLFRVRRTELAPQILRNGAETVLFVENGGWIVETLGHGANSFAGDLVIRDPEVLQERFWDFRSQWT
jgi:hypothetical protein